MKPAQMIFFSMTDSFMGEVYFRVSRHLGIKMSEVIREKFTPDMRVLIHKYSNILREEIKQADKLEELSNSS